MGVKVHAMNLKASERVSALILFSSSGGGKCLSFAAGFLPTKISLCSYNALMFSMPCFQFVKLFLGCCIKNVCCVFSLGKGSSIDFRK